MTRILVVEDDRSIREALIDSLEGEGYDVVSAADGVSGQAAVHEDEPDLIILDLMLPTRSGYEVCRALRGARVQTPILMLTARADETDRVLGLDLGADDYVTKPFSLRELLARVRALLRRAAPEQKAVDTINFGQVEVDFRRYEARKAGELVPLSPKEFGLLRALVTRDGEVVSRNELLDEVWGIDSNPTTRTVDNHVASLRAHLEPDPSNPRHILTVRGVGYRWAGGAS